MFPITAAAVSASAAAVPYQHEDVVKVHSIAAVQDVLVNLEHSALRVVLIHCRCVAHALDCLEPIEQLLQLLLGRRLPCIGRLQLTLPLIPFDFKLDRVYPYCCIFCSCP